MDKIRRIFPLLILFTLLSCADTIETRIPYRIVSLELDLTYQDKALNAIQAYKIYTQANIDQDREDELKELENDTQKITDKYIAKIDGAVEEKTKEILTV